MFSYNSLLKSNGKAFSSMLRTMPNRVSKRRFASMAKFNYADALNLESLLTEEEKMVFTIN